MALCRVCGKQSYVSRRKAAQAAKKVHERRGDVLRPYLHGGVWHLYTPEPRDERLWRQTLQRKRLARVKDDDDAA
jgi:hypothetical protein